MKEIIEFADEILGGLTAADPDIQYNNVEEFGDWTNIIYNAITDRVDNPNEIAFMYNYIAERLDKDKVFYKDII